MKTTILNRMASTAVAVVLPVAAFAQSNGAGVNNGSQTTDPSLSPTGSSEIPDSGLYDNGAKSSGADAQLNGTNKAGPFSTGVIVKDGSAYVVHRLQNEMSLPDGSTIQPNGVIKNSDGSTRSMNSGQILSIDGRMMSSPFGMGATPGESNSGGVFNSNGTPGWSTGSGPATSVTPSSPLSQPGGLDFQPSEPFSPGSTPPVSPELGDDNPATGTSSDSSELNGGTPDNSQTEQSPDYTD